MLGLMASDAGALRHKSFAACTPEELAAAAPDHGADPADAPEAANPAHRVARRSGRSPDMRRTMRESMRMHGEPAELFWRRRKVRLRPLILILDVSGSMADYSRNLLQFAYSAEAGGIEGRGVLLRHAADPDHPGARPSHGRTTRSNWPRRRCSTGRAAPGSASRWTPSSASGVVGGCAAAVSSWSAPTAWTGATRRPGRRRWSGCPGSVTGWCG